MPLSQAVKLEEFKAVSGKFVQELETRAADDLAAQEALAKLEPKLAELEGGGLVDAGALTGALRRIHPEFGEALKIAANDPVVGIEQLRGLAGGDDAYLASEAGYYTARLLIGQERFEEALPLLEKLRGDWKDSTLRSGESLYYQGVCNANMLQRTAAADNLNGFVENYPDASPRLVGAAWDLIASLERVHRGSLSLIHI